MMLPRRILESIDASQAEIHHQSNGVIVLCHHCKRPQLVVPNDLASGRAGMGQNPMVTKDLDVALRCASADCEFRAKVYGQWFPDTTVEDRKADIEISQWDGLRCPWGHIIAKPEIDPDEW